MRRACGGRHRPPKMVRESEKPSAETSFHLRTHRAATDNNRSMRGIGARGPHQRVCRRATKGQCSVNSPRRPRQQAARACEVCSPWRGATKGASWPRGSLAKRGAAGRWVVGARKIALTSRSLTDTGDGAFSVSFRNIARPPLATTLAFGAACHAPCAWGRAPRWPPQRTRMACMGGGRAGYAIRVYWWHRRSVAGNTNCARRSLDRRCVVCFSANMENTIVQMTIPLMASSIARPPLHGDFIASTGRHRLTWLQVPEHHCFYCPSCF